MLQLQDFSTPQTLQSQDFTTPRLFNPNSYNPKSLQPQTFSTPVRFETSLDFYALGPFEPLDFGLTRQVVLT